MARDNVHLDMAPSTDHEEGQNRQDVYEVTSLNI